MTPTVAIGIIGQILALCGLVSIRMFLPMFLYFFMMRLAPVYPNYAPEIIVQLAKHTPAWQVSNVFLIIFGILAATELAAVRCPEIKSFLVEDIDRYAKPIMSILLTCGIASTAQTLEVKEILDNAAKIQTASIGGFTIFMMILAGGVTSFCCRIRSAVLEYILAIDPGNSLGLQTVVNYLGEITLLGIFLVLVFLPILAVILTLCGVLFGMLFKRLWAIHEKKAFPSVRGVCRGRT